MKFAVLYQRRGKLIIGAQGRTTAGVLIGIDEPVVIGADVDAATLGGVLCKALERSRSPLPHPQMTEWPSITSVFLRAVGVKTCSNFVRDALLTTIESDGVTIRFQPHENRGARDAFQPMGLPVVSVAYGVPDSEIGVAAAKALQIAAAGERHDER